MKIYKRHQLKSVLVLLLLIPFFSCQPSEEAKVNAPDETLDLVADSTSTLVLEDETDDEESEIDEAGLEVPEEEMRCGRYSVKENGFLGEDTETQVLYPVLAANPASTFTDSLNKFFKREAERRHDVLKEEYRRGVQRKAAMGAKGELLMLRLHVTPSVINDRVLYLNYTSKEKYNSDLSLNDSSYLEIYDLQTGKKLAFDEVFSVSIKKLWREQVKQSIQMRNDVSDEQLATMLREAEKKYTPYMLGGFWREEDDDGNWGCIGHFWYINSDGEAASTEYFPAEKVKPYIKPSYKPTSPNACLCD